MSETLTPSPEHFEMMRGALDHIARTARNSRTSTRRLRWIERRAVLAIGGTPYSDEAVELPKSGGPNTAERLQKRLALVIWQRSELLTALEELLLVARRELADPEDVTEVTRADAILSKVKEVPA